MLLWKHGQPYAVWMRANIPVLDDEKRSGASQRPRFRPWNTSGERPAAMEWTMARPKKTADELRSETARFRTTIGEREAIRSHAARVGLDDTEFMRRRVLGTPLPPSSSTAVDPALVAALNSYAVALSKIGNNVNQLTAATHQGRDFARFWREIGTELEADLRAGRDVLNRILEAMDE